jgi:hypothetical protein
MIRERDFRSRTNGLTIMKGTTIHHRAGVIDEN